MWVEFKVWWQDGLYIYNPGKVVLIPSDLARRYIESGKAKKCNPPKWATAEVSGKKKRNVPSARAHIKRISASRISASIEDIANEVINED